MGVWVLVEGSERELPTSSDHDAGHHLPGSDKQPDSCSGVSEGQAGWDGGYWTLRTPFCVVALSNFRFRISRQSVKGTRFYIHFSFYWLSNYETQAHTNMQVWTVRLHASIGRENPVYNRLTSIEKRFPRDKWFHHTHYLGSDLRIYHAWIASFVRQRWESHWESQHNSNQDTVTVSSNSVQTSTCLGRKK